MKCARAHSSRIGSDARYWTANPPGGARRRPDCWGIAARQPHQSWFLEGTCAAWFLRRAGRDASVHRKCDRANLIGNKKEWRHHVGYHDRRVGHTERSPGYYTGAGTTTIGGWGARDRAKDQR